MKGKPENNAVARARPISAKVLPLKKRKGRGDDRFEKLEGLEQRQIGEADFFPLCCNRRVSFRVRASLRAASFAESSIDLGDKCPVPVFEKLGSAL